MLAGLVETAWANRLNAWPSKRVMAEPPPLTPVVLGGGQDPALVRDANLPKPPHGIVWAFGERRPDLRLVGRSAKLSSGYW